MNPPRTKCEQREIENLIELDIDDFIENKHLTEVPVCIEGLCEPLDD